MLIALPPSEGKTAPSAGRPLDLSDLALPAFTALRHELVTEVQEASRAENALDVFAAGSRIAGEIADQAELASLPTAPAHDVYTGVLYQGADIGELDEVAMARASSTVLVFSALFGATSITDHIPRYRLRMSTPLPGGTPASRWKNLWSHLDEIADGELLLDCRSGEYRGWKARGSRVLTVGAVRDNGVKRTVVSHNAKYFRGLLTGAVLRARTLPSTAEDVADIADSLVGGSITAVELRPGSLTFVESV